tara:strand:- start:369 stop:548 length:180 start_codon:yes stop_codon:yes gene_type:complete
MPKEKKSVPTDEQIAAHNAVMLPKMNAVIKAFNENPNDPVAQKNFYETLEFYRWKEEED